MILKGNMLSLLFVFLRENKKDRLNNALFYKEGH